jgi:hypothetical protein
MLYAAVGFVVLTLVAMLLYPGGTVADPAAVRYLFFRNFFSDLGRTEAIDGQANALSAILFVTALTGAGLSLAWFFLSAPRLLRGSRTAWLVSLLGSASGIVSGLCFVGVAWTPANLWLDPHRFFVMMAFEAFLGAALLYAVAILVDRGYPNGYALVFLLFAGLLAGYLVLLFNGPRPDSGEGLMIQATGQKVIVYAAIICMGFQGYGALQLAGGEAA